MPNPKITSEYSVYVFHRDQNKGHTDWEKLKVTRNKYRALRWAEKYKKNSAYNKIEVKCKRFDPRYKRPIDRTIKTITNERPTLLSTIKLTKFLKAIGF